MVTSTHSKEATLGSMGRKSSLCYREIDRRGSARPGEPHPKLQDLTLTSRHYGVNLERNRIHAQSEKLVAFYCLQAANQRRGATIPSCNGARVGLTCCIAFPFALQNLAAVPFNLNRVVCTCNIKT